MKKTTGAAVGAMSFPYIVSSSALDRVNKYKSSVATEANQPPRPNVLFILTDDQSYSTMSCTGSSFMKTPNLDRPARDGALFRNQILATSVCSPSRAAFMTGTYNWVNGVFANVAKWDPKNVILAQTMQKAGYATAHNGYFHGQRRRVAVAVVLSSFPNWCLGTYLQVPRITVQYVFSIQARSLRRR